jgi:hypothetical protein
MMINMQTPALSRFQAINPPSRPLRHMGRNEQEQVLVEVSQAAKLALSSAGDSD